MLLTWIDYMIIVVVFASMIIGLIRGFTKEILSLIIWVVAFIVATHYAATLSELFANNITSVPLRIGISYIILLIVVLMLGILFNFLVGKFIKDTNLGGTNRGFGLLFGFLRGIVLTAGLILLVQLTRLPETQAWQHSILLNHFEPLAVWLKAFIPQNVGQYFQFSDLKTIIQ